MAHPHIHRAQISVRLVLLLVIVAAYVSGVTSAAAAPPPQFVATFPLPASLLPTSQSIVPSGPPVVLASGTAFVAYYNYFSAPLDSTLVAYDTRHVPDSGASPSAGTAVLSAKGSMIAGVTALSDSTVAVAVAQLDDLSPSGASVVELVDNSRASATTVAIGWAIDRLNSTYNKFLAIPELNMIIFTAQLPSNKPPPYPQSVEIVAVSTNYSATSQLPVVIWNHTWVEPVVPQSAPLYYNGMIYFFHGDKLNRVNARTGFSSVIFNDPCKQNTSTTGAVWNFAIPSFDVDPSTGAALDAFILYANISAVTTVVCRFSHTTGTVKWAVPLFGTYVFDDIYGGGGNVFLTGRNINGTTGQAFQYLTWVHNATTGEIVAFPYARNIQDVRSYPRMLPPYMNAALGCVYGPVMIQQALGSTYAYCASAPAAILWRAADVPCYHTPITVSPILQPTFTYIGCTDYTGKSVSLLSALDGAIVWTYPVSVGAALATDNAFLYVVNTNGILTQLGVTGGHAIPPAESSALTGGEKAIIVIFVLVGVAAVAFAVVRYVRGGGSSVRRQAGGHTSLVNDEEVVVPSREDTSDAKGSGYGALA